MAAAAGGNVSYFHAGGIDRPLVITKGTISIIPHQNWRGQFARGTYADGAKVGQRSDCPDFPAVDCVPIQWPGERTTAWHELEADGNIQNWFGGLVDDMRDASGQMYRRNRYYDPQTGQFTQPDPIGLAGGLNAYGFAAGDPVSYSDPYGLSASCDPPRPDCPETFSGRVIQAARQWFADKAAQGVAVASDVAEVIGEFSGFNDFIRAGFGWDPADPLGSDVSAGRRALAGGSIVLSGAPTAGPRFEWKAAGHIFRAAAGHVNPASAASRLRFARLFEAVAAGGTRADHILPAAARGAGMQAFTQNFSGGQVWVHVYNGKITNAGVNAVGDFR